MVIMILMMITIIVIIITIIIMRIKIMLITAVVIINSPFQPEVFSTGSTINSYTLDLYNYLLHVKIVF